MNKKNEGQILVIVILVLFTLSIIVLGVIAIVSNDVEQSLGSKQYEISYNKSEESIQKILTDYADTDVSLAGVVNEAGYSCSPSVLNAYTCDFDYSDMQTTINVSDSDEVIDYELGKDETFKVVLNDYQGVVEVEWTGDVAMLFQVDYQQTNGEYKSLTDMHDAGNFVTSGNLEHPLGLNIPVQTENRVIIDLAAIKSNLLLTGSKLAFFSKFTGLKMKALMKEDANVSTLLSVKGNAGFPIQVRRLESVSYPTGADSIVVSAPVLITQIPFAGREPELMNYVIKTKSVLNK